MVRPPLADAIPQPRPLRPVGPPPSPDDQNPPAREVERDAEGPLAAAAPRLERHATWAVDWTQGRPGQVARHALQSAALLAQLRAGVVAAREHSRVLVELQPRGLGSLEIAVESRDGELRAHFHSTSAQVHAWLETNAAALREHLRGAGVSLQDLTLSTSAEDGGRGPRREADAPQVAPAHGRPPAGRPRAGLGRWRPDAQQLVDYLA